MTFAIWCLVGGGILVVMALAASVLRRLPLSAAMIYMEPVPIGVSPPIFDQAATGATSE